MHRPLVFRSVPCHTCMHLSVSSPRSREEPVHPHFILKPPFFPLSGIFHSPEAYVFTGLGIGSGRIKDDNQRTRQGRMRLECVDVFPPPGSWQFTCWTILTYKSCSHPFPLLLSTRFYSKGRKQLAPWK